MPFRNPSADPAVVARVAALLTPGAPLGWVPVVPGAPAAAAPVPSQGDREPWSTAWSRPSDEDDEEPWPPASSWGAHTGSVAPLVRRPVGPAPASYALAGGASSRGAAGQDGPDRPDRPDRLDLTDLPDAASTEVADPAGPPTSVLALLRSGRIDPGRRGVLALVAVGLVAAAVAALLLLRGRPSEQPLEPPSISSASPPVGSDATRLVVDVAGRVRRPGVVRLPGGSRVDDALRAAGGLLPGASPGLLNLAQKLSDGQQVLVGVAAPVTGGAGGPAGTAGSAGAGAPVDLNAATVADLDGLPGVGPVLAQRIVDWRTEHGRFASVDQLREVSGIGESKYASMKSKVRV